jgi:hypothetical protein
MERTGLTETQQRTVSAINDMIRRGQMPSTEELRSAGAESRFALVPKGLLESVVRKNALLFEQRGASAHSKQPYQSRPPKPTAAFLRSQIALLDSEIEKSEAPTRRRNLMNFILS